MGICLSCLGGSVDDYDDGLDPETKRTQQAAAAEKRRIEQESKGIKDPEALKRKQRRLEEQGKRADNNSRDGEGLRWQVG